MIDETFLISPPFCYLAIPITFKGFVVYMISKDETVET